MIFALSAPSFLQQASQPAFGWGPIHLGINTLRSADASGKGDHAREIDSNGTVAAATENAISPDDLLNPLQKMSVHRPLFLIQLAQRLNRFVGGHVLRIPVVRREEEAAFRTETAMDTVRQKAFHLLFLLIQHSSDFFLIDGRCL
jgi:hypothetical protein